MSSQSYVTKMKCEVTSMETHRVLISKEISWNSYKEICSGEPRKVNLGYNQWWLVFNNSLIHLPRKVEHYFYGPNSAMMWTWEVMVKFFSLHNIVPNWLNCASRNISCYGKV